MLITDDKFLERYPLASERRFGYFVRVNPERIRVAKFIIVADTPAMLKIWTLRGDDQEIDDEKQIKKVNLMKIDTKTIESYPSGYVYCLEQDLDAAVRACLSYVRKIVVRNEERAKKAYTDMTVLTASYEEGGLIRSALGDLGCRLD